MAAGGVPRSAGDFELVAKRVHFRVRRPVRQPGENDLPALASGSNSRIRRLATRPQNLGSFGTTSGCRVVPLSSYRAVTI
jgi:hypothetical protein